MNVTAVYQGSEISYGSGDSAVYAIEECIDSIDSMYLEVLEDIELVFSDVGNSGYPKYAMVKDYYYKEKQYF